MVGSKVTIEENGHHNITEPKRTVLLQPGIESSHTSLSMGCSKFLESLLTSLCVINVSSDLPIDWLTAKPFNWEGWWLAFRECWEGRLAEQNSPLCPCLGERASRYDNIDTKAPPLSTQSLPSSSVSPPEGKDQPCLHCLRNPSCSGTIWKHRSRQHNIFSLNQRRKLSLSFYRSHSW